MSTTAQVVQAYTEIRKAHDVRVEREAKAVALLRGRYEWRVRVELEPEGDNERGRREIDGDRDVTLAEHCACTKRESSRHVDFPLPPPPFLKL